MLEYLQSMAAKDYLGFLGLAVGLTGLGYAIYSKYQRNKEKIFKKIRVNIFSTNIVQDQETFFPDLTITYRHRALNRLTSSNLVLENSGTDVIRARDIASKDPILICPAGDDVTILGCELIETNNEASDVEVKEVEAGYLLNFDFLEPKDKVRLQILHTGSDSESLQFRGTLIGGKEPIKTRSDLSTVERALQKPFNRLWFRFPRTMSYIFLALPLALIVYLIFYTWGVWWLNILLALPAGLLAGMLWMVFLASRLGIRPGDMRESFRRQLEQNVFQAMTLKADRKRARQADEEKEVNG